ncbi:MAG: thioredoxin family protein [Muribaculaceae bacterium]|nr:thioredoxin family protein [Muribaculaceae bacterium]
MIVELNENNFETETKTGLKLVEFYTTWCSYCRKQRIELEELKDSDMWMGIVDAEESPRLAQKYGIKGFPTFVLLKDGEKTAEFPGFHQKSQLLNKLMKYIA